MSEHLTGSYYGSTPSELRLVLVGNIGCGKTSSADTILGQLSPISPAASRICKLRRGDSDGRGVTVVEAPRWYWEGGKMEEGIRKETQRTMMLSAPGPHAILLLVPINQFTEMEGCVPDELQALFGEEALDHTLVLLTCGDYLMGKTVEEYLRKEHAGLRQMIERCGGRYHVINNRQPQDREQVQELLEKVDSMVKKNGVYHMKTILESDLERRVSDRKRELMESYRAQKEERRETAASKHTPYVETLTSIDAEEEYGTILEKRRRAERDVVEGRVSVRKVSNGHSPSERQTYTETYDDRELKRTPSFRLNSDGAILSQMSSHEAPLSPKVITTLHHRISSFEESSPTASPTSTSQFPAFTSSSSTYTSSSHSSETFTPSVLSSSTFKSPYPSSSNFSSSSLSSESFTSPSRAASTFRSSNPSSSNFSSSSLSSESFTSPSRAASVFRSSNPSSSNFSSSSLSSESFTSPSRAASIFRSSSPSSSTYSSSSPSSETVTYPSRSSPTFTSSSTYTSSYPSTETFTSSSPSSSTFRSPYPSSSNFSSSSLSSETFTSPSRTSSTFKSSSPSSPNFASSTTYTSSYPSSETITYPSRSSPTFTSSSTYTSSSLSSETFTSPSPSSSTVKSSTPSSSTFTSSSDYTSSYPSTETFTSSSLSSETFTSPSPSSSTVKSSTPSSSTFTSSSDYTSSYPSTETYTSPSHSSSSYTTSSASSSNFSPSPSTVGSSYASSSTTTSSSPYSSTSTYSSSRSSSTFSSSSSFLPLSSSSSSELRLVLLGRSGAGKSAAGNDILGREEFKSHPDSLTAITQECEKKKAVVEGRQVAVVDTPDWFNSEQTPDEVRAQISSCVALSSPGPHAFLMCVPVDQPAKTELQALTALESVFGPEAVQRHTMILFTYTDRLRKSGKLGNISVEKYIAGERGDLLKLVEKCGDRFHVMEKGGRWKERWNVAELLEKVEQTVKEAGGQCYTCPAFQEAENKVREKQLEILRERRGKKLEEDREGDVRQLSSERRAVYSYMQPVAETEEEVREDEIEKTRDEAEKSVRNMNIESLPAVTRSTISPSLLNSIREKMEYSAKNFPKLLSDGSVWVSEGAKKVKSSPVWGKVGSGAQNVQKMVADSTVWGKVGTGAGHVSKLVGDRVPKVVSDGAKSAAASPMWGKVGSGAKSGAKLVADGSVRLGAGAKNLAQSPVWGKVGSGAKSGAKLMAQGSVKVGAGIGAGAKKVAQSPVWGKVGSGAKTGVKMVAESSVWEKIGTTAKKVPKVVIAGALLGLVLGVFLGGAIGGAVGAAAGSAVSEAGRRKLSKKNTLEKAEDAVNSMERKANESMDSVVKQGQKVLKTE